MARRGGRGCESRALGECAAVGLDLCVIMCYIVGVITIAELVWDRFNRKHIKKHRVSRKEVEQVCKRIVYADRTYAGRYLLVGRTDGGKLISVVLVGKPNNKYYVVTARASSRGERSKANEQENK